MTAFKNKCDTLSKSLAVLLGFMIPISTSLTQVILLCLLLTWFLAGNLHSKLSFIIRHPVSLMALGFFMAFVVGCFYSAAPTKDIQQLLWKMSKLLYIPFLLPIMTEEKWRRIALLAFLSGMLLTLVLAVFKMYFGIPIPSRYTAACVFKNHIDTNLMMAFAAFFVGHYVVFDLRPKIRYLGYALLVFMSFYILWMSEGRSGYIIFAVLWVLYCWQRFPLKYFLMGVLALSVLMSVVLFGSERFQTRLNAAVQDAIQYQTGETDTSFGARLEYSLETWNIAKQRPFFGWGTGSFKEIYKAHAKEHQLNTTTNPHNEYMNVMLQLGMVGLLAMLTLFGGMLLLSFRLPHLEQYLVQGLVLAIAVGSLANSWLMDFTSGYFFVALSAFCFGALPNVWKRT